jgi:SAM-dependent methyltransferase
MNNFDLYSKYYDLLYKDKNYNDEVDYILGLINQFSNKSQSIIELGCGSGNHAEFFQNHNYEITGIEQSEHLIKIAKDKNINNFTIVKGDITNFNLNIEFDIALSLFHVISYLTSNQLVYDCFINTHKHLKKDGLFIFDIWHTPAVYTLKPSVKVKRIENSEIEITRIAEPEINTIDNIVNVNFDLFIKNKSSKNIDHINELHPMRHFSIQEIRLFAKITGFEIIHIEEFLTKKTPNTNTWGVCYVLKKI